MENIGISKKNITVSKENAEILIFKTTAEMDKKNQNKKTQYTPQIIWEMFAETDLKFQETDRKLDKLALESGLLVMTQTGDDIKIVNPDDLHNDNLKEW